MNRILEMILSRLPKKWVTYTSAAALAILGILKIEASLPDGMSVWPDPPEDVIHGLELMGAAGAAVGLRRGQQKAENAATSAVMQAAAMPAVDVSQIPGFDGKPVRQIGWKP